MKTLTIHQVYQALLTLHGPQGWWPLQNLASPYHPGDYSYPHTAAERWEIALGAVLTQNTAWTNVEKALQNLQQQGLSHLPAIQAVDETSLGQALRPAGYFRQKAKKVKILASFWPNFDRQRHLPLAEKRERLLALWGIGPETADSILLYAHQEPIMVIDTYTKRILRALGVLDAQANYDDWQQYVHQEFPRDYKMLQELHALLVAHAKIYFSRQGPATSPLMSIGKAKGKRADKF
jgi:endonuclease-3 related protein